MSLTLSDTRTATVLQRTDPTVKLAVLLLGSVVLLVVFDPVTPTIMLVLAMLAAVTWGRIRPRTIALGLIPFVSFGFSLLAVNSVTRPGNTIVELGPIDITSEGVAVGGSLAVRTLLIGVGVIALMRTTSPERLVTSLHQHARLPDRAAFALLAAYRMLDDLPQEWITIRRAHAIRTGLRPDGGLPRSPRTLGRAAMGLLVEAIRRSGEVAVALETRALGAGPRTVWRPTSLGRRDAIFAVVVVGAIVAVLFLSHQLGTLRGPSVL